jgi:toxin ParE1/3/4
LKRYEVHFLAEAITDLDSLFCQIAEKASYEVADRYLARIERLCLSLESFPMRGTAISGKIAGLRKMGFEHRVTLLFKLGEERVEILRILYGGRDLGPVLEKL